MYAVCRILDLVSCRLRRLLLPLDCHLFGSRCQRNQSCSLRVDLEGNRLGAGVVSFHCDSDLVCAWILASGRILYLVVGRSQFRASIFNCDGRFPDLSIIDKRSRSQCDCRRDLPGRNPVGCRIASTVVALQFYSYPICTRIYAFVRVCNGVILTL